MTDNEMMRYFIVKFFTCLIIVSEGSQVLQSVTVHVVFVLYSSRFFLFIALLFHLLYFCFFYYFFFCI